MTTENTLPTSLAHANQMVANIEKEIVEIEHEWGLAVVDHAMTAQADDDAGEAKASRTATAAAERLEPARKRLRTMKDLRERLRVADERLRREDRNRRFKKLDGPVKEARQRLTDAGERVVAAAQELVLASKDWADTKADTSELRNEYAGLAQEFTGRSPSWPTLGFTQLQVADGWSLADVLLVVRGIRSDEARGRSIFPLKRINELARSVIDATKTKKKGKRPWRRN